MHWQLKKAERDSDAMFTLTLENNNGERMYVEVPIEMVGGLYVQIWGTPEDKRAYVEQQEATLRHLRSLAGSKGVRN